jgi:hypothetical protein
VRQPKPDPSAQMRGDTAVMTPEMLEEIAQERVDAATDAAIQGGLTSAVVMVMVDTMRVVAGISDIRVRAKVLGRNDVMLAGLNAALPAVSAALGGQIAPIMQAAALPLTPEDNPPKAPEATTSDTLLFLEGLADRLDELGDKDFAGLGLSDLANDCRRQAARVKRSGSR